MKKENNNTTWGNVAGWYDDLLAQDDTYQTKVILPNILRLVAPEGKKIIDVACGQGFFSKALAQAGAQHVLGLDISPNLIEIAKKNETEKLHFGVSPANDLKPVQSGSFDVATIVLALQNIKEMSETLKEVSRVLISGGKFVLVLNHPTFRIPKASSWGFDEKENIQYRRIDAYNSSFSVDVDMAPGQKNDKTKTVSFHRPLQDYFKTLSNAGFVVTGLEEWISHKKSEAGPRAKAEDQARKEFPMFLTIVAQKR